MMKKKLIRLVGGILLVQAFVMLALVLERISAALIKLYMFHFEWPQPIFLSLNMVVLFLGYSAMVIALGAWIATVASGFSPRTSTAAKWAIGVNVGGIIALGIMMIAKLAVFSAAL